MLRGPSSFANAFLYVGLGTVAIGLVISFVGTGEKGFKTTELRLIGPSLIGEFYTLLYCLIILLATHSNSPLPALSLSSIACAGIGLICCILRILFCICPSSCITGRKLRNKKTNKVDADYTTSLLRSDQSTTGSNSRVGGVGGGGVSGNSIKRVQIARGPNSMQVKPSIHHHHHLSLG